ncbi:methionine ABC transporter permease [Breznakia sp. PFB2-8]|uniref:methionine ABC transporter permease n=1 Tax=unclassified Breznakia TaxID=2623764 RepID=UPI0032166630
MTLKMLFFSGIFALIFGIIFGVLITVTKKDGILENKIIYFILDKFINFFRSIPFVILMALLVGASRLVMGTATGIKGTYIPLIFGTIPFFARQIESVLSEVDDGLIEASIAMGNTPMQIITRVYLKESIPGIIRSVSITLISLLGLTAMAGQVGGGGLGAFAIRHGYARGKVDATWSTVIIILLIVTAIQALGNYLTRKTTH